MEIKRKYETVIFFKPILSEEELKDGINKIKSVITNNEGIVLEEFSPEKKELPYEVKKVKEGYYYFLKFESPPDKINEIKEKIKITDEVLRYTVVKTMEIKPSGKDIEESKEKKEEREEGEGEQVNAEVKENVNEN